MADRDTDTDGRGTGQRGIDSDGRGTRQRGTGADDGQGKPTPAVEEPSTDEESVALAADPGRVGVWAHSLWVFKANPTLGWTHVIPFKTKKLSELLAKLGEEKKQLLGKVSKLAIVAHGKGGKIFLEPELRADNIANFSKAFKELGEYLAPKGKLIWMNCYAGKEQEGTELLTQISKLLHDRYIIGFTIRGDQYASPLDKNRGTFLAGDIREGYHNDQRPLEQRSFLTENSVVFAKWVLNGRVLRLPQTEELGILRGKSRESMPRHKATREPGLWRVTRAVKNGRDSKRLKGATLMILSSTALKLTRGKRRLWSGTFDFNPFVRPRHFDITFATGKAAGKQARGILRFGESGNYPDFDSLTICLAEAAAPAAKQTARKAPAKSGRKAAAKPTHERPDAFSSPAKSKRLLLDLKRVTPDTK